MKIRFMPAFMSLALAMLVSANLASASTGPVGEWRVADGSATVNVRSCGSSLCGYVATATSHQATTVGRQVFFNMKPREGQWSGTIVNVIDGQRYAGRISLVGEATLKVEGCVMGGMFCGGQQWSRVR
jgi:uncharacterized protein (DUF2147 family)